MTKRNTFFEGWSWFGTGTSYGIENSHQWGNRVKTKSQKFWGLIFPFLEVTGEELVGVLFAPIPILNRVNLDKLEEPDVPANPLLKTLL